MSEGPHWPTAGGFQHRYAPPRRHRRGGSFVAVLVPPPDDPHDHDAIRVDIQGGTVETPRWGHPTRHRAARSCRPTRTDGAGLHEARHLVVVCDGDHHPDVEARRRQRSFPAGEDRADATTTTIGQRPRAALLARGPVLAGRGSLKTAGDALVERNRWLDRHPQAYPGSAQDARPRTPPRTCAAERVAEARRSMLRRRSGHPSHHRPRQCGRRRHLHRQLRRPPRGRPGHSSSSSRCCSPRSSVSPGPCWSSRDRAARARPSR